MSKSQVILTEHGVLKAKLPRHVCFDILQEAGRWINITKGGVEQRRWVIESDFVFTIPNINPADDETVIYLVQGDQLCLYE